MPWYRRYYRRRYRKRRPWFRGFRKTFRRRPYYRRHWVRRPRFFYKKKLKKLLLTEYQPPSIRNSKCKGFLCLFQTTQNRFSYNFDMYEESWVPERLPGGGGFSIKNISLNSLYIETTMGHNLFTKTNRDYPLMRYRGCKIKFYQSADIDFVCTYSNTWPLISNLAMYNTMQPSIHLQQQHKIIVPSKKTSKRKKPYITKFIKPPTQMKNQWYFQKNLTNTPLLMLRTSACDLDHYYIGNRMSSTNITITTLNTIIIQNREFGDSKIIYSCRTIGTQKQFLYATTEEPPENTNNLLVQNLIMLINTQTYTEGQAYSERYQSQQLTKDNWHTYYHDPTVRGNPFHTHYLQRSFPVIISTCSPTDLDLYISQYQGSITNLKVPNNYTWTYVDLTRDLRYNPYKDNGSQNKCYFLQVGKSAGSGWDDPGRTDINNENLPLWLLLYGYPDFVKRTKILHNVDTNYIITINSNKTDQNTTIIVPISRTFEHGYSPYIPIDPDKHDNVDPADKNRWFPQYQYQQEIINDICLSGPGTPKIPPGTTCEAKVKYTFYFKWGGDLPPMSTMENPDSKPVYPIPNNFTQTTSFQNPTTHPASFLYSFDERRGILTDKATKRITKDWETKEMPLIPTEPRFAEQTVPQETPETTSEEEEEEENLYERLQHQRLKQRNLKLRILKTLQKLQKLE
nr:MAG: ORF1 [TTV-like mini virus]